MSTPTPFPEGVIARYVTVGGATVDLTVPAFRAESYETVATCTGCPASEVISHYRTAHTVRAGSGPRCEDVHDPDAANAQARKWAQAHAETCRAMPKLGAES